MFGLGCGIWGVGLEADRARVYIVITTAIIVITVIRVVRTNSKNRNRNTRNSNNRGLR